MDKENTPNTYLLPASLSATAAIRAADAAKSAPRVKGGLFSSLLSDATKSIREEGDQQVAAHLQNEEAIAVTSQWIREEMDERVAAKVAKDMQEELTRERLERARVDEKEAMNVAIEERRSMLAAAQAKRDMELSDLQTAQRTVIQDANEEYQLKEKCKEDVNYAKEVYECLQDEMLAEELQRQEEAEDKRRKDKLLELERADAKKAAAEQKQIHDILEKEYKSQVERDFEVARREQIALEVSESQKKIVQEKNDTILSRKMAIKSLREEHRRKKRIALLSSNKNVFASLQTIANQWEEADADVEDVAGGLCITLLLPHMMELKVRPSGKYKVVIDATRMVGRDDEYASTENASYCAEYIIEGKNVSIKQEECHHEYSSETGLLHVYIDNIHLDGALGDAEPKKSIISNLKDNFSRLFSRK